MFADADAGVAVQLFEVELLRWESVNDLSDEKDGSLMKKVLQEGDLAVWDRPMEPDLVTIKLSAKVAGTDEFFEKDLQHEFKMQDGFFCPAVKRIVQGMKQGEKVQVKVRYPMPFASVLPADSAVVRLSTLCASMVCGCLGITRRAGQKAAGPRSR